MKYIAYIVNLLAGLLLVLGWLAGIVIAKGFWSTTFAFFPLYSWYLVVERVLKAWGWV